MCQLSALQHRRPCQTLLQAQVLAVQGAQETSPWSPTLGAAAQPDHWIKGETEEADCSRLHPEPFCELGCLLETMFQTGFGSLECRCVFKPVAALWVSALSRWEFCAVFLESCCAGRINAAMTVWWLPKHFQMALYPFLSSFQVNHSVSYVVRVSFFAQNGSHQQLFMDRKLKMCIFPDV